MFTKKHYFKLAKLFVETTKPITSSDKYRQLKAWCNFFKNDNARFNEEKFTKEVYRLLLLEDIKRENNNGC